MPLSLASLSFPPSQLAVFPLVATIACLEADSVCGSHSVAMPIVLVLPYLWRLLQCLRQYKDIKEKTYLFNGFVFTSVFNAGILLAIIRQNLRGTELYILWMNWFTALLMHKFTVFTDFHHCLLISLKYSTAVPAIFLSALKYHVLPEKWTSLYRPLWLLSSVVNSLYSFYWDITRDWDLRYTFG